MDNLLDQRDYEKGKKRYESNIQESVSQLTELQMEEKSFKQTAQHSFGVIEDLPTHFEKSPIEVKHKILGSIFPQKLLYRDKKYRTAETNQVRALMCRNINEFGDTANKKGKYSKNTSPLVVPRGIEPLFPG
jgi:site-specific DNA recombinase